MRFTPVLLLAVAFSLQALPIYNLTFIAPAGSYETRPYSLNDLG